MDGWPLVLLFLLILVNAFFSMSEIAIISLNDTKLKKLAEDGHSGAKKVIKLTKSPAAFLSTIQIGVTLAGFLTSAAAADSFSVPLADWLWSRFYESVTPAWMHDVSLVIVTCVISYFSLVLGELVPKQIAMQKGEAISYKVVGILLFVKKLMTPFIKILSLSTNAIVRLFGMDPNANAETVTEEEILMMVDAGEEKGVLEEQQKEMITNIFEFDDTTASDVMTHRTDLISVEINDDFAEILSKTIDSGYSRIPVYEEDPDNIKGIIYIKDLLPYVGKKIPADLRVENIMREAVFVPEFKRCGELFDEMTENRLQMVFITDEYGGVAGVVTLEDLLEEIVGNMQDEYDDEEEEIEQVNETTFDIDGITDIEELEELLGLTFPNKSYDTVGGFILSELGRIPGEGEHPEIEYSGYLFRVEEVDERRIERVIVERLPSPEEEQEETED
ncbi:MAG: HlyC/CorC family transporter [Clostridia bacterium]|nr:HlyC/CorC family transporter [Clostridia bacterium]